MKRMFSGLVIGFLLIAGMFSSVHATTLNVTMTVDDGYFIYISTDDTVRGTQFGHSDAWNGAFRHSAELAAGVEYYIHVYAYNRTGYKGFLGVFDLAGTDHMFVNGTTTLITNTTDWQGGSASSPSTIPWGTSYIGLTDNGLNAEWPNSSWRYATSFPAEASWIWAGDTNYAYFSTKISLPTSPNPVPEPATLLLFGAGLAGLVAVSRKKRHKK
ncbi:PEP-CTERM sorting domain-containing protein [Desulfosarcina sp. OttesenSCG-928-B08]|nr:PEP-CTERM sorting domain-containing protein [Desulfosarcina sp. OttesenSCG-928-B08]